MKHMLLSILLWIEGMKNLQLDPHIENRHNMYDFEKYAFNKGNIAWIPSIIYDK